MAGIRFLKPSCPMHNTRLRPNKIANQIETTITRKTTSNNVNIILPTLSRAHVDRISPLVATNGPNFGYIGGFNGNDFLEKVVWGFGHVIVPVGESIAGIIAVWAILPRILRRLHKLIGPMIPFEKSVWDALDVSLKNLVTSMAFLHMCVVAAPSHFAFQDLPLLRTNIRLISFLLFLQQWKTNVITRIGGLGIIKDYNMRDNLLSLDIMFSGLLFLAGCVAIYDAYGVVAKAVRPIVVVGMFAIFRLCIDEANNSQDE